MTGSIVNHMYADSGIPKVGDGATLLSYSDRNPATIIEVILFKSGPNVGKPRLVRVQGDQWKVVSGSEADGSATYEFSRDENGPISEFRWTGKSWKGRSGKVAFGFRERYYDPHF